MPSVPHDDVVAEIFREDPAYALTLLNDILGDPEATPGELLIVLRQFAKANGGLPAIAEKAALNPTQLYRMLSPEGNPSLISLTAILKALGLKFVAERVTPERATANKTQSAARTRKKPTGITATKPVRVKASRDPLHA